MFAQTGEIRKVPFSLMRKALNVINVSKISNDQKMLWNQMLEELLEIVCAESSIFFVHGEGKGITFPVSRNISRRDVAGYAKYYGELDPLRVIYGISDKGSSVTRLDELVDFQSFLRTEYYNDFYKPQGIHHKLIVSLGGDKKVHCKICLHRPSSAPNFSRNEIAMLQMVIPYFSHALEYHALRREIGFKDGLLKIVNENTSTGTVILDDSLQVIHMDNQGKAFCSNLFGIPPNQVAFSLPEILTQDCRRIQKARRINADLEVLPRTRIFQFGKAKRYKVTSRLIEETFDRQNDNFFLIFIEEINNSAPLDKNRIKEAYGLSNREGEVALYLLKGLKNAEIAEMLFISETTVKWHIHHIFEKAKVKTRVAFAHKVLTSSI